MLSYRSNTVRYQGSVPSIIVSYVAEDTRAICPEERLMDNEVKLFSYHPVILVESTDAESSIRGIVTFRGDRRDLPIMKEH